MRSLLALAKITVKVDTVTKPIDPVKQMLLEKMKDVPDDYVITFKDVKKAYPDIADKLKNKLFGDKSQLTITEIKELIRDMPVTDEKFWLSEVPYKQGVQQQIKHDQIAIQLNFTPEMISEIKKSEPTYTYLTDYFAEFEGKHEPLGNQTFAWARVYKFDDKKVWVVEEMQTDFIGWDKGFKMMTHSMEDYLKRKFDEKEQKEIFDFFKKHFDRWEHKFLSSISQMARTAGMKEIWIFDEESKQGQQTSPSKLKWYYSKIPKEMGMKKESVKIHEKEYKVWKKVFARLSEKKVLAALQKVI